MKSAFNILKPITAFLCTSAFLIAIGCSSPDTGAKQHEGTILKEVNKDVLLAIVTDLSKSMSQNHASVTEVMKLLKTYSASYKINFTGNGDFNKSADYLNVYLLKNEKDSTQLFLSAISLTSSLHKQLTFNDLKSKFGDWEKVPANARPMDLAYVITSFNYSASTGISIIVESKKLPESPDNSIEQIKLTRIG